MTDYPAFPASPEPCRHMNPLLASALLLAPSIRAAGTDDPRVDDIATAIGVLCQTAVQTDSAEVTHRLCERVLLWLDAWTGVR